MFKEGAKKLYIDAYQKGYKDGKNFNKAGLGFLRQFFAEQSEYKLYSAKDLYAIFEKFVPLMTKEQQKQIIEALKKI